MSRGQWVVLFLAGGLVASLAKTLIGSPGYMDAEYYYALAVELASGKGFQEPFIWNYLTDPSGIPHPSHLFWMPLTSVLAAASMLLFGIGFQAAQLPFVLICAVLPAFTARLALWLGMRPGQAWFAGLLSAFSGFFLPFLVTTDSFAIYALAGGSALWCLAAAQREGRARHWLSAGTLIGVCALTRADGLLFLVPAFLAVAMAGRGRMRSFVLLLAPLTLIMLPWWLRNLALAETVSQQGVWRVLWLRSYDELFSYPADRLAIQHWLAGGWGEIVAARARALSANLVSSMAVNGLVFLAPFMVWGAYRTWKHPLVRLASAYTGALLLVMSVIFPFAGARGGYFHSSASMMPWLWCMAVIGLDRAIEWGSRRRGWRLREAAMVFRTATLILAMAITLGLFWQRVARGGDGAPAWGAGERFYRQVGQSLPELRESQQRIAVNNPPGFYLASGIPSVVIPYGPPETLKAVIERYGVQWVLLDRNHPAQLRDLYEQPESLDWLELHASFSDAEEGMAYLLAVKDPP